MLTNEKELEKILAAGNPFQLAVHKPRSAEGIVEFCGSSISWTDNRISTDWAWAIWPGKV